jgi:ubiquitin carboxyl-terminal hydrolase 36/42
MKVSDPANKLSCGGETNSKKSSSSGWISLVPARKKCVKVSGYEPTNVYPSSICKLFYSCVSSPKQVPFPYDEFLKLYNWKDFDSVPCGLINCGNRYDGIILATVTTCSVYT